MTGAAGAIGRAISLRLAREGLGVLCVDASRGVERTVAEVDSQGGRAVACVLDLTEADAPARILSAAGELGRASVLVNNAGITRDARVADLDSGDFRAVVAVNLVAPLRLAEGLAPQMEPGGVVVNIASRAALGNFGQANYVVAKAGLIGATRALAVRCSPGLRVNAVAPGLIDTPMTAAMPPQILEKLVARIPAGRSGTAEEIAAAVAFLTSEQASYVNGQVLLVCGGRSIAG